MKTVFRWCIFFLLLLGFGAVVQAAGPATWGDITQANYDTNVPGTILMINDPLSGGGMNLTTGDMTTSKNNADIVFSSDGKEIGASGIIDLGEVDINDVSDIPTSGYSYIVKAVPGHVYIASLADGSYAKLEILMNLGSSVKFQYAVGMTDQSLPDGTFAVKYDKSIPGTILSISDPTSQGGLNFSAGQMTNNAADADIAISGDDIGSRGIIDLGAADSVDITNFQFPTTGYVKMETLLPDHVYISVTHDGSFVVFYVAGDNGSTVDLIYKIIEAPKVTSVKINQALKYSGSPVTLTVTAKYSDGTSKAIKSGITWKSSNTKIASVDSKGVVRFSGNSGTVTITASYQGKTSKVTCTVGNVVKSISTPTKLAYSTKSVRIVIYVTYSNGKKVAITKGVVYKSSNTKVAKVSSTGLVTFTGQNGPVTITATYQGRTASLKTNVFIKANEIKFYTGKAWKLSMDYVGLDVGTLKLNSNGTYTWKNPHQGTITGKWVFTKSNTVYLYNFGYNRNKTFEMYRNPKNSSQVFLNYAPGVPGTSDYYVGV